MNQIKQTDMDEDIVMKARGKKTVVVQHSKLAVKQTKMHRG
jgi:hypothetical protein